jgi:peptidyl-dipeptidase A
MSPQLESFFFFIVTPIVYGSDSSLLPLFQLPGEQSTFKKIFRIDPGPEAEINFLLKQALTKAPLIAFAVAMENWRWEVFRGNVKQPEYNARWWEYVERFQGLAPPTSARTTHTEEYFDPGMKFHVSANMPYARYFLATFMQFQFHEAYCRIKGHAGPLHKCQVYNVKAVGRVLRYLARGN